MTITSFKIPNSFVSKMDTIILNQTFTSRSELIKTAIKEYIEYFNSLKGEEREGKKSKISSRNIESYFTTA